MPFIATFGSGGGPIGGGLLPLVQSQNGIDVAFNDPQGTFTIDPLAQVIVNLPQATINNEMLHYDLGSSEWVSEPNVRIGNNAGIADTNSITIGNGTFASNESICISTNAASAGGSAGDILMITPNAEISVREGGFVEINNEIDIHNGGDTKNLKVQDDDYLTFNSTLVRQKQSVVVRWLPTSSTIPYVITLPEIVQTDIPFTPNISNLALFPDFNTVQGGVEYIGSRPLSAIISITVSGGRQAPQVMQVELGIKIAGVTVGGISTSAKVDRYRSNGNGVSTSQTLSTRLTVQPNQTITPYLRQLVVGGPTQYNMADCIMSIY